MVKHQFKTTNIRGKEYVEVNQRILYFRTAPEYRGWSLETEMIHLDNDSCVIRAVITNDTGSVVATGFAQEDRTSSHINKTSYVENCETSAWGRALANLGIGIESSIASSNEVSMAIAKQENAPTSESGTSKKNVFKDAVEYIKKSKDKSGAFDRIIGKYGDSFTEKQKEALQKFVG
jgi:hypothetical protein